MGTHAISAAALKKCAVTDSILHFSSSISNPVCSHEWIVGQNRIFEDYFRMDGNSPRTTKRVIPWWERPSNGKEILVRRADNMFEEFPGCARHLYAASCSI